MSRDRAGKPLAVRVYSALSRVVAPIAYARVKRKLSAHGTAPGRIPERMGHSTAERPAGPMVWFHAASVGESLSVLRLITHMGQTDPGLSFLITSGTATSAEVLAGRLPPRCQHQFAPLDSRPAVKRFLAHWSPDAAVFVESELWPNMLGLTAGLDIPLALLNARISDKSARNWKRFPQTARHLMSHFRMIHTQDARTTGHLHDLGLMQAQTGQNLKSASGPLPFDQATFDQFKAAFGNRPIWVASSTHPGEEDMVLDAHRVLLDKTPDLLLVLVPRHPERAAEIETLISDRNLSHSKRSTGAMPARGDHVYLADTMGETGLWYALSDIVCLGGSFAPVGGHNPYEPAFAGAAILHGPLYANFARAYADMLAARASISVETTAELTQAVQALLSDPGHLKDMGGRAMTFATAQQDALAEISETLFNALSLR